MRTIRRLSTLIATLVLTLAALAAVGGAPAQAASQSRTFTLATASSTQSTGTLTWDNATWALTITARTGTLASGTCVTAYFDWASTGHHDARAVRNCRSNSTYTYSFTDSNPSNLRGGVARMGLCYGTDDTIGTCTYASSVTPNVIPMDWTPWPRSTTNPCVLSWTKRSSSGAVSTFIDAHSQRSALSGGAC